MLPLVAVSSPPTIWISVLLPQPLGPRSDATENDERTHPALPLGVVPRPRRVLLNRERHSWLRLLHGLSSVIQKHRQVSDQ